MWRPASNPHYALVVKNLIPLLASLIVFSSSLCAGDSLDVYLFAGQSNMVGKRSKAADLPADCQGVQENVLIFTGTKWEPYRAGLGQPAGFGPEVSAALELAKATGKPVGIVKHSVGGTNLAQKWNPAVDNNLYTALKTKAAAAGEGGYDLVFKGVFWMQGGADARSEQMANQYATNLDALIAAMREDFETPGLPFVAGLTSSATATPHPRYPAAGIVREAQMQERDHYAYVDCSEISRCPDKIHFDTAGIVKLGRDMARAMLKLMNVEVTE